MSENATPIPSIEGLWQMVRAELGGEKAPELVVEKTQLELKDGHYAVWFAGEVTDRGTYVTEESSGRLVIKLVGNAGLNVGRTIPCVYQIARGRIRICFGIDGVLPTEFISDDGRFLAYYRKIDS